MNPKIKPFPIKIQFFHKDGKYQPRTNSIDIFFWRHTIQLYVPRFRFQYPKFWVSFTTGIFLRFENNWAWTWSFAVEILGFGFGYALDYCSNPMRLMEQERRELNENRKNT